MPENESNEFKSNPETTLGQKKRKLEIYYQEDLIDFPEQDNARMISLKRTRKSLSVESSFSYRFNYDGQGNLAQKIETFSAAGMSIDHGNEPYSTVSFEYDQKGYRTAIYRSSHEGESVRHLNYDPEGFLASEQIDGFDERMDKSVDDYFESYDYHCEYDPNGRLDKKIYDDIEDFDNEVDAHMGQDEEEYKKQTISNKKYIYNEKGNVAKVILFSLAGLDLERIEYSYDDQGRLYSKLETNLKKEFRETFYNYIGDQQNYDIVETINHDAPEIFKKSKKEKPEIRTTHIQKVQQGNKITITEDGPDYRVSHIWELVG